MKTSTKILQIGAITFVCTFSTVAVAQHLFMGGSATTRHVPPQMGSEFRELPVLFPQGKLYCADGSLAYQKLYPRGWQKLSDDEAVRIAVHSVDESCAGGPPDLCKEYRARLSKLRAAIRTCF